jgi:prepilin-type N-terminal cleavage/methylation domain-containing protein
MSAQKKLKIGSKGFTLVELMVSIAIVAILATIGFTVFTTTQQNARDAKRKSELAAIADSIEATKAGRVNAAGATTYFYNATDFNSDFGRTAGGTLPYADSQSIPYCIKTVTTGTATGNPTVGGTSTWTTTTCPTGSLTLQNSLTDDAGISGELVDGTVTSWLICTLLERAAVSPNNPTGGSANIYCINSQQ